MHGRSSSAGLPRLALRETSTSRRGRRSAVDAVDRGRPVSRGAGRPSGPPSGAARCRTVAVSYPTGPQGEGEEMSRMHGSQNGNAGRRRGRRERKPRAAVVIAVVALVSLAAVAYSSGTAERPPSEDQRPGTAPSPEASPSEPAASFPTAAFADISEDPVSEEVAAKFQAALRDMAGGGGIAATVMSPDGTWSGAAGKADGVR